MLWTRLLCPWHFRGSHAWSFWATWNLGHLRCAVICNIWVFWDVCTSLCYRNGEIALSRSEKSDRGKCNSTAHTCCRDPVLRWRTEGTASGSGDGILIQPEDRRDLDVTANWQSWLHSILDPSLALKWIFKPLSFGQFRRAGDKKAGWR